MSLPTMKDAPQALRYAFDDNSNALKFAGTLVPESYDTLEMAYVPIGTNGAGKIGSITYILAASVIAILNFTYNIDNKLESVVRS